MTTLLDIINIVLPVFLVIGIGYLLGRRGFIDDATNTALSKLVFYVAAPVLLFRSVLRTPLQEVIDVPVLLLAAGVSVVMAVAFYLATARSAATRRGVLTQGTHRSNMVFVGLPVIINAFGESVLGPAAVLIAFIVVVYNFLAVLVLTLPHENGDQQSRKAWLTTAVKILRNPLILGSGGGIVFSVLNLELPVSIDRGLELVGRIAMPLALLAVGAGLDMGRLRAELRPAILVSVFKLIVYPALICAGLAWLGRSGTQLQSTVLILASPTAVVSCIMAREMRGDEQLAAAIVIATTLGSLLTLSLWLAFFRLVM